MRATIHSLVLAAIGVVAVGSFGTTIHMSTQTNQGSSIIARDGAWNDRPQFARDSEWNNRPQLA